MSKIADYQNRLKRIDAGWEPFLLQESHLPGPRSNLELAQAAASLATEGQVTYWLSFDIDKAPTNTPEEFLAVCGTIAIGYQMVKGNQTFIPQIPIQANDPRWRIRECVAMALQILGDHSMESMVELVQGLTGGSLLEKRAAAAAICEPRLLAQAKYAQIALEMLNHITAVIPTVADRKSDDFKAFRKGLGYCWSVAVAASSDPGKEYFSSWILSGDYDIRWIIRENLKKNRLQKMDSHWVANLSRQLQ